MPKNSLSSLQSIAHNLAYKLLNDDFSIGDVEFSIHSKTKGTLSILKTNHSTVKAGIFVYTEAEPTNHHHIHITFAGTHALAGVVSNIQKIAPGLEEYHLTKEAILVEILSKIMKICTQEEPFSLHVSGHGFGATLAQYLAVDLLRLIRYLILPTIPGEAKPNEEDKEHMQYISENLPAMDSVNPELLDCKNFQQILNTIKQNHNFGFIQRQLMKNLQNLKIGIINSPGVQKHKADEMDILLEKLLNPLLNGGYRPNLVVSLVAIQVHGDGMQQIGESIILANPQLKRAKLYMAKIEPVNVKALKILVQLLKFSKQIKNYVPFGAYLPGSKLSHSMECFFEALASFLAHTHQIKDFSEHRFLDGRFCPKQRAEICKDLNNKKPIEVHASHLLTTIITPMIARPVASVATEALALENIPSPGRQAGTDVCNKLTRWVLKKLVSVGSTIVVDNVYRGAGYLRPLLYSAPTIKRPAIQTISTDIDEILRLWLERVAKTEVNFFDIAAEVLTNTTVSGLAEDIIEAVLMRQEKLVLEAIKSIHETLSTKPGLLSATHDPRGEIIKRLAEGNHLNTEAQLTKIKALLPTARITPRDIAIERNKLRGF